jgi:hypothetical protein
MTDDHTALDKIKCPNCGELIPVSEALSHQIAEKTRAELKAEALQQQKAFAARENELKERENALDKIIQEKLKAEQVNITKEAEKKAHELVSLEIEDLKRQAAEKDLKLNALQQTELELRKQKRELEEREKTFDLEFQRKLAEGEQRIKSEAAKEVRDAVSLEIGDLKMQAAEKDRKLAEAGKAELELRKQKRELEEKGKTLELEVARQIDAEREKIQENTIRQFQEEHRLKDAEKDKKLQDAIKANEELRRKLQQGSQQTQGEVLELELEELIKTNFPSDQIEQVPKGVSGADVVQKVMSRSGHLCGTIVWESKHTKAWNDGWLQKLKDDQRAVKADIAVLISEVLPKDCKHFGQYEGVWIANSQCAVSLAVALRSQLVEVAMAKLAAVGKKEKMETLYQYLSGSEFKQRVEAIVEAFVGMQDDLQEERRVTERRWAKREKQIQKVISNTSGMYGDFQGLIGSSLQTIPSLTAQNDVSSDEKQNNVPSYEKIVVDGSIEDKSPFDDLR